MTLTLTIGNVDLDGYNGRDFHPEPTDEGLVGTVTAMETEYDDDGEGIKMFTVVLNDERMLQVMEHEVAKLIVS